MFTCKQFHVDDHLCAMKVTTDSLLFGSWVNLDSASSVLDVGCGSGILSLMALQKTTVQNATVMAIDKDESAVQQTKQNIQATEWRNRASIKQQDYLNWSGEIRFDHIISNPPYFPSNEKENRVHSMPPSRRSARQQISFTPDNFFAITGRFVSETGLVSLVFPTEHATQCEKAAYDNGFFLSRCRAVNSSADKTPYLQLMTFSSKKTNCLTEPPLTIYNANQQYTDEYKALCSNFYLRF